MTTKHNPPPTENLITKPRVAERLGISIRTLEGLMRDGALPFIRIAKRRIGFRPADVDRFIEDRTVPAAPVNHAESAES